MMDVLAFAGNHLWQSTLFTGAVALLALACRRQRAQVRYALWLAASLKFLVPFAALTALGGMLSWRTVDVIPYAVPSLLVEMAGEPFSQSAVTVRTAAQPAARTLMAVLPLALLAVWAAGACAVMVTWSLRWRRVRRSLRDRPPVAGAEAGTEAAIMNRLAPVVGVSPVPIVVSDTSLEPGMFGVLRPVLLWPREIGTRLTAEQVEAIVAHELCHLRRRDNLAAALHMAVQAVFWFHPLTWWIGARLVDERERACDEEVLRLGSQPEVYAESILRTCRFYVESPLACVAGVTGADLKRRIEQIMTHEPAPALTGARKYLLVAAALAAFMGPVAAGAMNPPPQSRALPAPATLPAFEAVSIRPNVTAGRGGRGGGQMQPGRYVAQNLTLKAIVKRAYGTDGAMPGSGLDLFDDQVAGGPAWLDTDKFDIVATTPAATPPPQMRLMLQRALAERFNLAAHWETRELPVYVLTMASADGRLGPGLTPTPESECAKADPAVPPGPGNPPPCGAIQFGPGQLIARGAPVEWLARTLSNVPVITGLDRMVLDRTGLKGNYGFALKFAGPQAATPDPDRPQLITALQEQLGLRLEARREPVDVLVIDAAAQPEPN